MKIQCKKNTIKSLSPEQAKHVLEHVHMNEVNLNINQVYCVYGVTFNRRVPWFLICESDLDSYPIPHCAYFFDILDAIIPQGWQLVMQDNNVGTPSILPSEWAMDTSFLERLIDGDEKAISSFNIIRQKYQ